MSAGERWAMAGGVAIAAAIAVLAATQASADAPPGHYEISTDTVKDKQTGLTWQRIVDVDAGLYSWADAKAYCQSLPVAGGGWRLPSLGELQTIVDETRKQPSIDKNAFPVTPTDVPGGYWTSSQAAGWSQGAWRVDFDLGASSPVDVTGQKSRVRCVR